MPLIWKVATTWTGGKIGTGYTNLYFTEGVSTAQAAATAVNAFWQGVYGGTGNMLPTGITITTPTSVDVIDPVSGILTTTIPVTTTGPLTGSDPGTYAAPAGLCVTWRTAGVVNGHRVQGRTFIVPVGATGLQADGTPSTQAVGNANGAAAALIAAAPELVVWHRPESLAVGGGSAHPVLAPNVKDRVAVLTSRR